MKKIVVCALMLALTAPLCWLLWAAPADKAKKERPQSTTARVPWTTSRITGSPEPPLPYKIVRVFPKLAFKNPLLITSAPGTDRLFVGEHEGKIYSFPKDQNCATKDLFLDPIKELQGGLAETVYGLTFHPQFAKNRYCYVCYVLPGKRKKDGSRVSRFKVSDTDPPRADPKSEKVIITWQGGGHNGGDLKFGKDGFLYISTGDGSSSAPADELNAGQDLTRLFSGILRIDVDKEEGGKAYAVPPDNPFMKTPGARPEKWAYGLRNPWRMSFDRETGDLWVGDVGWELWEMIYRIQKGGNYGWAIMEGPQPVKPNAKKGPTPILPPTLAFPHTEAASITGGYVYRGKQHKDLLGSYICGDWVTHRMWATKFDGDKKVWHKEIARGMQRIVAFGEDHDGEIYFLDYDDNGTILQLAANEAVKEYKGGFPQKLSETGLFASVKDHKPAPGVVPFSINAEQWSDHATAERLVALPGKEIARVYDKPIPIPNTYYYSQIFFPKDGVLARTMSLELKRGDPKSRRRLETQILHTDGTNWFGYTYEWNDEQTDATLVPAEGKNRTFLVTDPSAPGGKHEQNWHFPSRAECMSCHTPRIGSLLAFTLPQLNRDHDAGAGAVNQLRALKSAGVIAYFRKELAKDRPRNTKEYDVGAEYKGSKDRPSGDVAPGKIANPHGSGDLTERARAYLHVNCAHCHTRGAGGSVPLDVRYTLALEKTNALGVRPVQGNFDIKDGKVIAPGDPFHSVLYYRIAKLGKGRMPHIGSELVDEKGIGLIRDWIDKLPAKASTGKEERALLDQLGAAKDDAERGKIINQLLSSTSGALMLACACGEKKIPDAVRPQVVAAAKARSEDQVRDLFRRFVPDDQRPKPVGPIDPAQLLSMKGDVKRGRELVLKSATMQCMNCHRIQGNGVELGPDLSEIGKKYKKEQILDKLLNPSKSIEPKYVGYLVATKDGKQYTGVLIDRTDNEVVLRTAEDKDKPVRILMKDMERKMEALTTSLMPTDMLRDLTAEQVADLLEYLGSLKGP